MPRTKKEYLSEEIIKQECEKIGNVYCPSCKSENVFRGATYNKEIATKMWSLELYYHCNECDRYFRINLTVMKKEE